MSKQASFDLKCCKMRWPLGELIPLSNREGLRAFGARHSLFHVHFRFFKFLCTIFLDRVPQTGIAKFEHA